jgi:hypothetical protein
MKRIEAPYLLFALVFGFMTLIAPYLVDEYQYSLEGRLSMLLFQAGMQFACALATAKHLHDKWVQEEIEDRQARLKMPRAPVEEEPTASEGEALAQDSQAASVIPEVPADHPPGLDKPAN